MNESKNIIKHNSRVIRQFKSLRKPKNYNQQEAQKLKQEFDGLKQVSKNFTESKIEGPDYINYHIFMLSHYLRLMHVAYSLLKGKTYDQIEHPKEHKVLRAYDWKKIENMKILLKEMDKEK